MSIYRLRKFTFDYTNWLNYDKATIYLRLIPLQVTEIVAIICSVAVIYLLYKIIKEKNRLYLFLASWFLVYYIVFTSEHWTGIYRYTNPLLPIVAILSIFFLSALFKKLNLKAFTKNMIYLLLLLIVLGNTIYLTYNNWEDRYPPINQMIEYISTDIPADARILRTMTPNPYDFYIQKYNAPQYFKHMVWANTSEQNMDNLYTFLIKNNYTYMTFISPQKAYFYYPQEDITWYEIKDDLFHSEVSVYSPVNLNLLRELETTKFCYFILNKTIVSGVNKNYLWEINKNCPALITSSN